MLSVFLFIIVRRKRKILIKTNYSISCIGRDCSLSRLWRDDNRYSKQPKLYGHKKSSLYKAALLRYGRNSNLTYLYIYISNTYNVFISLGRNKVESLLINYLPIQHGKHLFFSVLQIKNKKTAFERRSKGVRGVAIKKKIHNVADYVVNLKLNNLK